MRTGLHEIAWVASRGTPSSALAAEPDEMLVLRVDRTDPSKNIVRGFKAFARMLELHPELRRHVTFRRPAATEPARRSPIRRYLLEIHEVVDSINRRFGSASWRPIDLRLGDDLPLAVAAYTRCSTFSWSTRCVTA